MENISGLIPAKKIGVLVYIGDTEFFHKKLSSILYIDPNELTRAISEATEGIIIAKGSEAFKEGFDREFNIGDKISFKGHFGQIYPRKKGTYKVLGKEEKNISYYRILKDTEIELFVINEN